MAEKYGDNAFPVPPPVRGEAAGDRVRSILLGLVKAVLNAYVTPAWNDVCPGKKVVETTFPFNPEWEMFRDGGLPAVYLWRNTGDAPERMGDEWREQRDFVHVRWVFPVQPQTVAKLREPIVGALTKALDRALFNTRDPAYVHPDDTDETAPTYLEELDALVTLKATSTSAQTFATTGFDGARGQASLTRIPKRGVVINLRGSAASWVHGSTVVVTGEDVLGNAVVHTLTVDTSRVPGRLYTTSSLTKIVSVVVGPQADAAATFSIGLGARAGCGTSIVNFGHFDVEMEKAAQFVPVTIAFKNSPKVNKYPAIEWVLRIPERLVPDAAAYQTPGAGIDQFGDPAVVPSAGVDLNNPDGVTTVAAQYS